MAKNPGVTNRRPQAPPPAPSGRPGRDAPDPPRTPGIARVRRAGDSRQRAHVREDVLQRSTRFLSARSLGAPVRQRQTPSDRNPGPRTGVARARAGVEPMRSATDAVTSATTRPARSRSEREAPADRAGRPSPRRRSAERRGHPNLTPVKLVRTARDGSEIHAAARNGRESGISEMPSARSRRRRESQGAPTSARIRLGGELAGEALPPAPIAARTASLCGGERARERRFARFVHAIKRPGRRRREPAPSRATGRESSRKRHRRSCGCCPSDIRVPAAPRSGGSPRACSSVTPLHFATARSQASVRSVKLSAVNRVAVHSSVSRAGKAKPRGMTPATV